MRSVLRWLRRIVLTALALGAIGIGAALITAHTGWGREQLRRRVETALRDAFPGGARVARLTGSPLGALTFEGIELDGRDHRPVVTVATLRAELALWPLVVQTARLDRVVADGVRVFVRDQPPEPPGPPPGGEASAWRVELARLELHRAEVAIDRGRLALGDLDVAGAVTVAAGRVAMSGAVHGRWTRAGGPPAALTAGGSVVIDGAVRIPGAIVTLDGATIVASALALDLEHPTGAVTVVAPADLLAAQLPELGGPGGIGPAGGAPDGGAAPGPRARDRLWAQITMAPDGEGRAAATRVAVTAAAGESRLSALLRVEPAQRTASGLISATSIDLGVATRGRIAGRGHLLAAIDAGPDRVRGALIAHGDVAVPGVPLHRAGAAMVGGLEDATVLALGSGDDGLQVAAAAAAHVRSGAIAIDRGFAVVRAQGVALPCERGVELELGGAAPAPAAPGAAQACPRVTGALEASARLAGRIAPDVDLAVSGTLGGARVAGLVRDVSVDAVRGSFALAVISGPELAPDRGAGGGPAVVLDAAHLAATGIRRAGRPLGAGRIDVERRGAAAYAVTATARPAIDGLVIATQAVARHTAAGLGAALGATTVTLPGGAVWRGRGGSLTIPDAARAPIRLDGLTLRRDGAALALAAGYARDTGDVTAHVAADRVELASLPPIAARAAGAAGAPGVRGLGRATLDVARRAGQWRADATLGVTGLAVAADGAPVDATAHLALVRRRVALDARATGPALGELSLAFESAAPGDPFDVAAWRRLDRDAIRTAAITARQVGLAGLTAAIRPGALPGLSGTIDGAIDLAPAAAGGELAVRGLALPSGTLDGSLTIAPRDGDLDVHAAARLDDIAAGDATARFAVPRRPFDPASWQRRGRDLLRGAEAKLDDVVLGPELLTRLGLPGGDIAPPLRGRARARLAIGAGAGDARLTADVTGLAGGPLVAPLSPHVELVAGPGGSHVHAELGGGARDGGPALGVVDGDLAMTVDGWLDDPAAALRAPLTASWTLPATPAVPVLALFGRRELEAGTLEGSAAIRGSLAAPLVPSARLVVRDARIAPRLGGRPVPALRTLEVAASWDGTGTLAIDGSQVSGGELHASASGRPGELARATGTARLTRLDIAPIAAFLPAALASAAGVVDGDLALSGGRLTGKLHLTGGALPLAPAIGTLRDATAELTSDGGKLTAALDGRLGRGTIHLTVDAASDDLARATVGLKLEGVSPIAALRPVISADITARLQRSSGQLRGDVTVSRAAIALRERTGTPLLDTAVPVDLRIRGVAAAAPAGPRPPAHPWLVLHVQPAEIQLDARELSEGIGVLGTLYTGPMEVSIGDTVGVTGKVQIASDAVDILGRRYIVESTSLGPSGVEFDGTLDPRVNVQMYYQFPELTLTVGLAGRLSKLDRPSFSSDPGGYTQDQLFGFFLGGEPSTDASSQTRDQARAALAGAGTRVLSARLGRQISRVLPVKIDALSCEPDPAATTAGSGSCTVGKWLSQRLFVAYRQRLQPRADENTGDVQLQVRMGSKVLIQATGGDRGYYGADLLWRHRW